MDKEPQESSKEGEQVPRRHGSHSAAAHAAQLQVNEEHALSLHGGRSQRLEETVRNIGSGPRGARAVEAALECPSHQLL